MEDNDEKADTETQSTTNSLGIRLKLNAEILSSLHRSISEKKEEKIQYY